MSAVGVVSMRALLWMCLHLMQVPAKHANKPARIEMGPLPACAYGGVVGDDVWLQSLSLHLCQQLHAGCGGNSCGKIVSSRTTSDKHLSEEPLLNDSPSKDKPKFLIDTPMDRQVCTSQNFSSNYCTVQRPK